MRVAGNLPRHLLLSGILGISTLACSQSNTAGPAADGTPNSAGSTGGSTSSRGGSIATPGTGGAALGGTTTSGGTSTAQGGQGSGGTPATGTTAASTGGSGTTGFGGNSATGGGDGRTGSTGGLAAGGAGSGGRAAGGGEVGGTTSTGGASKSGGNGGGTSKGGTNGNAGSMSAGGTASSAGGSSSSEVTIVPDPSWTCGMPEGIPSPTGGTLVFRATLQLGATHDLGNSQFGHRRILDVKGGTLKGDRVEATLMNLGLDLELTLSNGSIELEQINILKASDGTLIYMRNCGVAAAGDKVVRVVADFEVATSKSLAWLNTGKYVGTRVVDAAASTLQLDVYDVSKVTASATKVQLKDPAGVPNVSWDCVAGSGSQGATVFTENVTLGSSVSVGASKRGNRNIIPITGGTTTGKVEGSILAGGGDYQLSGLDARYTLAPKDGEFILVRNCGAMSSLFPVFEARADGPYAFLNENKYISSAPGSGSGGVSITFYERK